MARIALSAAPFLAIITAIERSAETNKYFSVWIGEIQWMRRNGFGVSRNPILKPLNTIECRDALLNSDGSESIWPRADVIIGNPPFLGGKLMRTLLGSEYVDRLFSVYDGRVSAEADLVTYWFGKAWGAVKAGNVQRAGLVATNSIRGGANRRVVDTITNEGVVFDAWGDEPWVVDGAAVRVSIICFALSVQQTAIRLNGDIVTAINADLTGGAVDLTRAVRLSENLALSFQGVKFGGPFELPEAEALKMLAAPLNPNHRPNSDVIKPWINGMDLTRRPERKWCVAFPPDVSQTDAALYELPFEWLKSSFLAENVRRTENGEEKLRAREGRTAETWWIHQRPREELRKTVASLNRFIATPEVAKHRIFLFFNSDVLASGSVYAIARDDDTTFGILHSRFHEQWALRLGTSLEDRPRYTPSTTFETFPFPEGLTLDIPAIQYATDPRAIGISSAARRLNELREAWLNPSDLVEEMSEIIRGSPSRMAPRDERAAATLKRRTLTNLYNERPAWLANAHRDLDNAVAAAYGWSVDISEESALAELFMLNQSRAAEKRVEELLLEL